MKIYIKYMVSQRCKKLVEETIKKMKLQPAYIFLGMVELPNGISLLQRDQLKRILLQSGLELMDDRRKILIERVKNVIFEMIHYFDEIPDEENFSEYISEKLDCDYGYLAKEFSNVNGITIQQFIINTKIEKAKELLLYDNLSLTAISYKLKYSSVAHLSNQFKKTTGQCPSFFKEMQGIRAKNQDNVGIMQYSDANL